MSSAVISFHARLYHPLVCTAYLQALHSSEATQLARLDSEEVASTLVEQALQLQPLHLVRRLQQGLDLELQVQHHHLVLEPPS
ncbi:hypothetical protein WJX82_006353 [Trebouxia sp. C0006]